MGINVGPPPKLFRPMPPVSPPQRVAVDDVEFEIANEQHTCSGCGAPIIDTMDKCNWCGTIFRKHVTAKRKTKKQLVSPKLTPSSDITYVYVHTIEKRFFNKKIPITAGDYNLVTVENVFINTILINADKWEYVHGYEYVNEIGAIPTQHYIKIKQKLYPGDNVMVHYHISTARFVRE